MRLFQFVAAASACDVTQNGSGTISSPGWPGNYGGSEVCSYTLLADPGKIIEITFDAFNVEDAGSCMYDSLSILGVKYCGVLDSSNGPPASMELHFESVSLNWVTDHMDFYPGWSFTWQSIESPFDPLTSVISPSIQGCTREENFPAAVTEVRKGKGKRSAKVEKESSTRIIGGVNAGENEWPWIVRLILISSDSESQCGGTIIDNNWVLSAAHCCEGVEQIRAVFSDLSASDTSEANEYELIADSFVSNPLYAGVGFDLCLIHFTEDLIAEDADGDVEAACISETHPDHGSACWVAGWGVDESTGLSDTLKQAGVNIMDQEYCLAHVGMADSLEEDDICAGVPDYDNDELTDGGIDSCQGDSGGPLICDYNGKATVVGAVSRGTGCALEGTAGLYSAVSTSYEWIQNTIKASHPVICTKTLNDATVSCDKGDLLISVPVCALEDVDFSATDVFMNSASCQGQVVGDDLVFDASETGCRVAPNKVDDLYVYNATITSGAPSSSIITREEGIALKFSCILDRTQTVSLDDGINVNINYIFVDFGFELGSFEIEMTVYDADDFSVPASVDHVFHTPDKVYIGIENKDSQLSVAIQRCIAFPQDDPSLEYELIDSACAVDSTTTIISSGSSADATFEFEAFSFASSNAAIQIECDVSICETADCNVCSGAGRRRRREADQNRIEKITATIFTQD